MHISIRQPKNATARFAAANAVPYEIVDGNDVLAVASAARRLVESARRGEGPGFLEAVTYRWFGHVDWREDVDVGVNRSQEDLDNWRARDPVRRLQAAMVAARLLDESAAEELAKRIHRETEQAWAAASDDPFPAPRSLLDRVYSA
jgi:pyruvate dehydrogenase E1 component alpha subunit